MKQLGKLLIEEGMVDQAQLDEALAAQQREGGKLGSTLVKLGFLTEEALYYFLALQLGAEFVEVSELPAEYPGWMFERQGANRVPTPFEPKT